MKPTNFILVCQHYRTRRWCVDAFLESEEQGREWIKSRQTILRSTHPVTELLKIDPPARTHDSIADFPIKSPPCGGEFYSLPGRTFQILGRHQTKPWKPA